MISKKRTIIAKTEYSILDPSKWKLWVCPKTQTTLSEFQEVQDGYNSNTRYHPIAKDSQDWELVSFSYNISN